LLICQLSSYNKLSNKSLFNRINLKSTGKGGHCQTYQLLASNHVKGTAGQQTSRVAALHRGQVKYKNQEIF